MIFISLFSFIYKTIRSRVIHFYRRKLEKAGSLVHLEDAIDFGDRALIKMDRYFGDLLFSFQIPKGLEVSFYDLVFPSPIISASFKSDMPILNTWLKLGLGGVTVKTIMGEPRSGNQKPRIKEIMVNGNKSLINAMGLPGPGVGGLLLDFSESELMNWRRPIGFSIGGNSLDEYIQVFQTLERGLLEYPQLKTFFEFNISCPNVPGEKNYSLTTAFVSDLLSRVRQTTQAIVGIKLSPDFSDELIVTIVSEIKKHVRTFVNVGNTQFKQCLDLGLEENAISIGGGGLSGPPLFDRTLEMVKLVKAEVGNDLPIIATGGVSSVEQVEKLLDSGATLVGMATAIVQDQYVIPKINTNLTVKQ